MSDYQEFPGFFLACRWVAERGHLGSVIGAHIVYTARDGVSSLYLPCAPALWSAADVYENDPEGSEVGAGGQRHFTFGYDPSIQVWEGRIAHSVWDCDGDRLAITDFVVVPEAGGVMRWGWGATEVRDLLAERIGY
jgi:hypothetical protein